MQLLSMRNGKCNGNRYGTTSTDSSQFQSKKRFAAFPLSCDRTSSTVNQPVRDSTASDLPSRQPITSPAPVKTSRWWFTTGAMGISTVYVVGQNQVGKRSLARALHHRLIATNRCFASPGKPVGASVDDDRDGTTTTMFASEHRALSHFLVCLAPDKPQIPPVQVVVIHERQTIHVRPQDVVLMVYDLTQRDSFESLLAQWSFILKLRESAAVQVLLVGTKVDQHEQQREVSMFEAKQLASIQFDGFCEVCACQSTGQGMDLLRESILDWIVRATEQDPWLRQYRRSRSNETEGKSTGISQVMTRSSSLDSVPHAARAGSVSKGAQFGGSVWLFEPDMTLSDDHLQQEMVLHSSCSFREIRPIAKALHDLRANEKVRMKKLARDNSKKHTQNAPRYHGPTQSSLNMSWQKLKAFEKAMANNLTPRVVLSNDDDGSCKPFMRPTELSRQRQQLVQEAFACKTKRPATAVFQLKKQVPKILKSCAEPQLVPPVVERPTLQQQQRHFQQPSPRVLTPEIIDHGLVSGHIEPCLEEKTTLGCSLDELVQPQGESQLGEIVDSEQIQEYRAKAPLPNETQQLVDGDAQQIMAEEVTHTNGMKSDVIDDTAGNQQEQDPLHDNSTAARPDSGAQATQSPRTSGTFSPLRLPSFLGPVRSSSIASQGSDVSSVKSLKEDDIESLLDFFDNVKLPL